MRESGRDQQKHRGPEADRPPDLDEDGDLDQRKGDEEEDKSGAHVGQHGRLPKFHASQP
jgi:hypothetical protein